MALQQWIGRQQSSQSLSVGSSVASSTAVFGSQTRQVRVVSDTVVRYVVGNGTSASSTVILNTGAYLPANIIETVNVSPGQQIGVVSPVSSVAAFTVTEMG